MIAAYPNARMMLGFDDVDEVIDPSREDHRFISICPMYTLNRLVDAAAADPRFNRLWPFTSLHHFGLSRTVRSPYSTDCPSIVTVAPERYRVTSADGPFVRKKTHGGVELAQEAVILGVGNIDEALDMMARGLPENADGAVDGNEEDLRRIEGKHILTDAERLLLNTALAGRPADLDRLIRIGVDIDVVDYQGFTPLMQAVRSRNGDAVRLLVDAGANVDAVNRNVTAMVLAEWLAPDVPSIGQTLGING